MLIDVEKMRFDVLVVEAELSSSIGVLLVQERDSRIDSHTWYRIYR